jgi:hypothetical protein
MTADKLLAKFEEKNEYHFHHVNREWMVECMEEYAKEKVIDELQWVLKHSEKGFAQDVANRIIRLKKR